MLSNSALKKYFQLTSSLFLGLSGLLLICLWSVIFDNLMTLRSGSLLYNYWQNIPMDIATDFYFFNWTNSEDFSNKSVKPKLEELGPYRFWQREEKVNITWNDNGTITFQQRKFWYYDESEQNGKLDDVVVSADPLTVGASYILKDWNYYIRRGVFIALSGRLGAISRANSVRELLFEGYREPLIRIIRPLPFFSHLGFPAWERFGWMYSRNGSADVDGIMTLGTGINSTFGKLYSWNYQERTPYFQEHCADINGSAGQFFPRNLAKDHVEFYSSDLRRTLKLNFQKEEVTSSGIMGYRYIADDSCLDNGTLVPENKCFCVEECIPSGVINLSSTRHGIPIFVSLPHFYRADPYYFNLVEGLKQDPEIHELGITIEPTTGVPIKVDVKVQLNMLIMPISGVPVLENAPKFYLPIMWTRQTYEINGFLAFMLKLLINVPTICTSVGILMLAGSSVWTTLIVYKKNDLHFRKIKQNISVLEDQRIPLKTELREKT